MAVGERISIEPGATFFVRANGWPVGLVGTMGVKLVSEADPDGPPVIPRTTAGIVEIAPGAYRATLVAPLVAGSYVPVVDDGGAIVVADDDTWVVEHDAIGPVGPAASSVPTPHTAARVWVADDQDPTTWVDGQPDESERQSAAFGCFLQLPRGDETGGPGGRRVKRPALMFPPPADGTRLDGGDEVLVTAPELTGPDPVRYEVVGSPAASGPPGGPVIIFECVLARVENKGKAT